jgi:hypothetical protein
MSDPRSWIAANDETCSLRRITIRICDETTEARKTPCRRRNNSLRTRAFPYSNCSKQPTKMSVPLTNQQQRQLKRQSPTLQFTSERAPCIVSRNPTNTFPVYQQPVGSFRLHRNRPAVHVLWRWRYCGFGSVQWSLISSVVACMV